MTGNANLRWAIFGTGNIGRILALRLCAMGVPGGSLSLFDPDSMGLLWRAPLR